MTGEPYRIPKDDICIAVDRDGVRCTEAREPGNIYCERHSPKVHIPPPANPADPVSEGLAILVHTGRRGAEVPLLACTECGVLLWDVERHWRDAHALRLEALRARD